MHNDCDGFDRAAPRLAGAPRERSASAWKRLRIALLALLAPGLALAQTDYPSRPVKFVVGVGAGASGDIGARVLAQKLSQLLGQQFLVENRPGAGTSIAAEFVARAPKDGYTLLLGTVANTINATLSPHLAFDFSRDFAPISLFAVVPNVLVAHPSLGVSTVGELIALAKSKPGDISFGSSGIGTSPHLSGELFNSMAGVKLVHVPYGGSSQAATDLVAGRLGVMFSPASSVTGYVSAGRLKALAVTTLQRMSGAPNLPTISESGLPGFDTSVWMGIVAPSGTPRPAVDRLAKAIAESLKSDDVFGPLQKQGLDAVAMGPEEFGRYIDSEIKKWAEVVKRAGMMK